MASRNYLVNFEDLSLMDRRKLKVNALAAGLERCGVKSIGEVNADILGLENIPDSEKKRRVAHIAAFIETGAWPRSIDQRELATGPALNDLAVATALDEMVTAPLAAVGGAVSCFQAVAAPQLLVGRLCVFYGVSIETVPIPVSYLLFRKGGVAGNIQARFDLQTQDTRLAYDALFSEPIVYDPQDVFAVQVICKIATGVAARVHLHNFLFEPAGTTIA